MKHGKHIDYLYVPWLAKHIYQDERASRIVNEGQSCIVENVHTRLTSQLARKSEYEKVLSFCNNFLATHIISALEEKPTFQEFVCDVANNPNCKTLGHKSSNIDETIMSSLRMYMEVVVRVTYLLEILLHLLEVM